MLNFLCCFIHRVPYLEKWSSLIPLQIDWPLTIHQHLRSFIKLLMFFYALMLVMFILHLISIFRIFLAPICSSCLEMEEYLFHCFFFTVLLSLSWLRVLCGFFFFFFAFAFANFPWDGSSFTILSSISFQCILLNRCDSRFDRLCAEMQAAPCTLPAKCAKWWQLRFSPEHFALECKVVKIALNLTYML